MLRPVNKGPRPLNPNSGSKNLAGQKSFDREEEGTKSIATLLCSNGAFIKWRPESLVSGPTGQLLPPALEAADASRVRSTSTSTPQRPEVRHAAGAVTRKPT